MVVLLVVAVGLVASIALTGGRSYPSAWDPQVADLASYVEKTRDLTYKHPVEIVYVPDDEFADSVKIDETQLDEEDQANLAASEAALRAFGLLDGSVDLLDSTNGIQGAGTLAYYSPEDEKVYVRGTEVTPSVKSTLVHELTHVLQDQHFDLQEMLAGSPAPGAVRSLVEGDANRIQSAYVDGLPVAAQEAIASATEADVADAGFDAMPDALVAATSAPYVLGEPAIGVLFARGGNSEVNQAFLRPPTADVQILDPKRLGDLTPEPVVLPELPEGATDVVDGGTSGALFWNVVLARRVGLHPALAFADSWAGDSSTLYQLDGRTCTVNALRATDDEGAGQMLSLLQAWLSAGDQPLDEQTFVRSGTEPRTVVLGVCDPGTDGVAPGDQNSQAAVALAAIRLEFERQALEADLTMPQARCVAAGGIESLDAADLGADADPATVEAKVVGDLQRAMLDCMTQTR